MRAGAGAAVKSLRALAVLALALLAQPAAADSPSEVVENLHAALLEVMQDADALGFEGRFERLEPVVRDSFGFAAMGRVALGRTWAELERADRERFVDRFARLSTAIYADRFDGYGGETFETLGEDDGPRGTVLVRARITSPGEEPIALHYLVAELDGRPWIIDVLLEGRYSELARYRSEYGSIVAREGFEALIRRLERRTAELAQP